MKQLTFFFFLWFMAYSLLGQAPTNQKSQTYQNAPAWAKLMYAERPNIDEVDRLYWEYYNTHSFQKSFHTQFYRRWRRAVDPFIGEDGFIEESKKLGLHQFVQKRKDRYHTINRSGNWSLMGPFRNFYSNGLESGAQTNVFSIGSCAAQADIMYCGTEPGELYKTTDGGENWFNVSYGIVTAVANQVVVANAGFKAIAVHPINPDIVYAGAGNEVYKSIDGGFSWEVVLLANAPLFGYIETPAEIHIHTTNPDIVLLAGRDGIYRTEDAGENWTQVLTNHCYDIKARPGFPNILYTVRNNLNTNTHQFLRSEDGGMTWEEQINGWYASNDPARSVNGARIAVSNADTMRIYAFLIGDAKEGDEGFIGIYKSTDGGDSWINTKGYDGAPHTASFPNLIAADVFSYNQGFYNCAMMASNSNADEILVGGIGMWRSEDGGDSFQCVYNYGCGNYQPMHVDMQDFRAFGDTYWASTDGGIYKSEDLFASQPEFMMKGIHGADFWGFGSGWNYDILVGGTFHNGVDVYCEDYPFGDFLDLGGGEPASGYVNPGDSLRVYYVNQSRVVPPSLDGNIMSIPMGLAPNESPWFAESSEMLFHPDCYNHIYLGSANQIFKSTNGGGNYTAIYDAPENTLVLDLDISRKAPKKMYAIVRSFSSGVSLHKTTDEWQTSTVLNIPAGGSSEGIISLDPENDEIIWMAYPRGGNGNKVFKSVDGGQTWNNETSSNLNFQTIQAITTIGGTDGGVYINSNIGCYYKNNSMDEWVIDDQGLPLSISTRDIRPFYRDGKVRIASFGKGLWESPLYEQPTRPVATIMANQLRADCIDDTFYFDDYSMLNHEGASWYWTFENASIASSTKRNPEVTFNDYGEFAVTLEVTNAQGISSTDTLYVTVSAPDYEEEISEDFETVFPPESWQIAIQSWSYNNEVGGYGLSDNCMSVNNFINSQVGARFEITAPVNMENNTLENSWLSFDLAYAEYAPNYRDTLEILISLDCGSTWASVYKKWGQELATAPNTTELFIPTADQWRTDSIDLTSFIGQENVLIKFSNINGYGQPLYVDNVNMGGITTFLNEPTASYKHLSFFPNPIHTSGNLSISTGEIESLECSIFKLSGKLLGNIFTQTNTPIDISRWNLSAGTYIIKIQTKDQIKNGKLVVVGDRR